MPARPARPLCFEHPGTDWETTKGSEDDLRSNDLAPQAGVLTARAAQTRRRTRIQAEKERAILAAALDVFSEAGFRGASLDEVALRSGMSKPNLLYYFNSKETLHSALLARLLDHWMSPLRTLDPAGDPIEEIRRYIRLKLEMARDFPRESRLFANEVIRGAPHIGDYLSGPLKALLDDQSAIIARWVAEGRLAPINPRHLIFAIWATTQHYADFDAQISALLGPADATRFEDAQTTIERLILPGLAPDP